MDIKNTYDSGLTGDEVVSAVNQVNSKIFLTKEYFVYISSAANWESSKNEILNASGKWYKSIVFRADTHEIYNRGVAYGITPALSDSIDSLETFRDICVAGGLVNYSEQTGTYTWNLGSENIAYSTQGDKLTTTAKTVQDKLKELDTAVYNNKAAELTYKTVKLTADQINALSDKSLIKEAYQVVSVSSTGAETKVGEVIKIYKDSSIVKIESVKKDASNKDGQFLKYTYTKADGSDEVLYVDLSEMIIETEVENGIQSQNGKLSIKKDATSESFLTVGADGIKLSGVQNAINNAKGDVMGQVEGINNKITEIDGDISDIKGDINAANGEIGKLGGRVDTIVNTTIPGAIATAKNYADGLIDGLDVAASEKGTNVKVKISETNGKVSLDSVNESYATVIRTTTESANGASLELESGDQSSRLITANDLFEAVAYFEDVFGWQEI